MEQDSGRVLPCFLAASLDYEGETFAALYPVNAPVCLATLQGDRIALVEDETEAMVAAAASVCADKDIELLTTPVVLTARGPGLELDADTEALDLADEDDDESEEALVLAELDHDGQELLVVQTIDPLYVVGKQTSNAKFVVPSDAEIDAVSDTIEQLVIEFEDSFAEDEDDLDGLIGA